MGWKEDILRDVRALPGTAGVVVRDAAGGDTLAHNADRSFPSASLIKLAVLWELYAGASAGRVDPFEVLAYDRSRFVEGGLLHHVLGGATFRLDDLALLMVSVSDNTAANLLMDRLGMDRINASMRALGLGRTVLGRRMLDFEAKKRGEDNFTSPGDVADLLKRMLSGPELSPEWRARVFDILSAQKLNSKLPAHIPYADVDDIEAFLAHKTAELPGCEHDAGVFFHRGNRPVVTVVMTEGIGHRAEGAAFCARIGKIVYDAFLPEQKTS